MRYRTLSAALILAASWLKPGDGGRLAAATPCGVTREYLEAKVPADGEHLIILPAGTAVHDLGFMVTPGHEAASYVWVRSGEYHGAKCWITSPAPRVR